MEALIFLLVVFIIASVAKQHREQEQQEARVRYERRKEEREIHAPDSYGRTRAEAKMYAYGQGESGFPRWMESFSEYDLFGEPTVFHPDWRKKK